MNPNKQDTQPLPPQWAKDELSSFLHDAFKNNLATFVQRPVEFALLSRIEDVYKKATNALANNPSFLPSLFLLRSHGAFLGSVRSATSGQIPETYPLLRSCLEYALYAHHIELDEARAVTWIARHENSESVKACRKEFAHHRVIGSLAERHPTLHAVIEDLYERSIDFGAHPNERGLSISTAFREDEGVSVFQVAQLQSGGPAMDLAMRFTASTGIGALSIFEKIFESRFRLLAIDAELELLRRGI